MSQKHYHFIGIGGIGMGALATIMLTKGYRVTGSDVKENDVVKNLRAQGAQIFVGHDKDHIEGSDFVVYSSAINPDNPEMKEARARKTPLLKRAELLSQLMNAQTGIGIAGAHGKTTTTSMVSHIFIKAGLDPTTAIGGIINETSHHAGLGKGEYFIAELDESDGSFLYFKPTYAIITNIDWEHVDYYPTWDDVINTYQKFVQQTDPKGCVVFNGDDVKLRKLVMENHPNTIAYGFSAENNVVAKDIQLDCFSSRFVCEINGETKGVCRLNIPGRHNVLNALACFALGLRLNISCETIRAGLEDFKGVQRRFQLKGDINDILVIDDYGHHPTEITATLNTAKSFNRSRVITIFQPHRYTRTKLLMEDFVRCFSSVDHLIITDIYAASEAPIENINAQSFTNKIKESHTGILQYLPKQDIVPYLQKEAHPGDLVLFLGAGDITKIGDEYVAEMKKVNTA